MALPSLLNMRNALSDHEPETLSGDPQQQAAVAMVLREVGDAPEVLFIERARREGDPWSGHMAFPGGRIDPGDDHARSAAERETFEEVGVELGAAEALGRLDDLRGRHAAAPDRAMVISAFVYHVVDPAPLRPNWEVAQAFWFPLASLLDAGRHVEYTIRRGGEVRFPGILVGEPERHVVWGLTYRFLEVFFEIVGHPLPDRWKILETSGDAGPPAR
jgi:8-oxo-dGTP pyrophosphatase MutT (NUDIX family)